MNCSYEDELGQYQAAGSRSTREPWNGSIERKYAAALQRVRELSAWQVGLHEPPRLRLRLATVAVTAILPTLPSRPLTASLGPLASGKNSAEHPFRKRLLGPDAGVAASMQPWRVSCRRCRGVKVKVEQVPWASGSSVFTSGFEELAAYLAQVTDRTAVSRLLGISWVTVGSIVERVVARRLDGARFAKLRRIGVDEFSYRKRHRYLTIVR